MPRQALAAVLQQLPVLVDRLRLGPEEALEVIADDELLFHLEQRRIGRGPLVLTPSMAPDRLLAVVDGMGLALDLDRRLAPSRVIFRARAMGPLLGPTGPGRPQEGR